MRTFRAQAVWPVDAPALHAVYRFRARFSSDGQKHTVLRLAGATVLRVWLNGEFVHFGPARTAHGFARVDEIDLTRRLQEGENALSIEVVHYGANGYSAVDDPGFLLAEVDADGHPVVWTGSGEGGFHAYEVPERLRRVPRYSFQRPFSEAYRLGADAGKEVRLHRVAGPSLLPRRAPYPGFERRQPVGQILVGTLTEDSTRPIHKDRAITGVGTTLGGVPESELQTAPSLDLQRFAITHEPEPQDYRPGDWLSLDPLRSRAFDFGRNATGLIGVEVRCTEPACLYLSFDEILSGDRVDFLRLGCANVIELRLEPGEYRWESAEPYTFRFLDAIAREGKVEVRRLSQREVAHPAVGASFACDDPRLNRIFRAAVETFRQNAVDIFMDCPSRERAGWLCDSFFTARAEHWLTGESRIERDFLENYLLAKDFAPLPEGMVAMCFPADHPDGVFIPQWSLWLLLQLEEHVQRTGDREFAGRFRHRAEGIVAWFRGYENADGLLEKLPSWNFVEWSRANEWMQDVNYPTNALYAAALDAVGRLYRDDTLAAKARTIRETIHRQAYDGAFFVDNALRRDGRLELTTNRSEVVQYFMFFFGVASPEGDPDLWQRLVSEFGPGRTGYPEVAEANMFVGQVLRVELLAREGLAEQVCRDIVGYFAKMAETTGTLWENKDLSASANHGFASYAAVWLFQMGLGIRSLKGGVLDAAVPLNHLAWCEGTLPTPDGGARFGWQRDGTLRVDREVPFGWQ